MGERVVYMPVEALGMTEEEAQIRAFMGDYLEDGTGKSEWEHFTPDFIDTHYQETNVPELIREVRQSQENYQDSRISQPEATIVIDTPHPIAIVHFGDWHLGSIYTDHDEVMRKVREVKAMPNTYCVFMSNLIDNAIPAQYPDSMLANAIPPDQQVMLMRSIARELDESGKLLGAVTSPCHEGWTWKKAGQDVNALIFGYEGRKFPVLENGGRLTVKMPGVEYMGALYHQVGPFESQFNETHAIRQMNRLKLNMAADWVAAGHKHYAAANEVFEGVGEHRKLVAYLRTGAEKGVGKIHDQWAIGRYGDTGEPSGQTVHLFPHKRNLMANVDFDTAMLAHQSLLLRSMAQSKA